ncbi:uncharacterized protein LOC121871159 isoform X2 [Homarus americanus]|uniref:uncharacterized protein LOC121871159 isoform X2 n=1 Tax=Homarus americanus TaxID=6706 RepID=UPI001C454A21|nr:uncharacterized protein LOC121871159 isoform X2 [Homarus americanus]XP_042229239.1 uncharacterized protein LOC121871159 isoform X2 [Homarus americanus]
MEWRLTTVGTGRTWNSTAEFLRAREYKLPHTDSGQNSLEYWDYSVELEMLKGPEDLQLAAELGKTLLERNRELEANIKHQHAIIEDQLQEIEYLSKQTAALREVNDSRLRIYEQLEISIQELEKNNQRLSAEGASDKRKIKSLCGNLESLEGRCDELQKNLEEARAGAQQQRGRNKRRSIILEEQSIRRSHSCENTIPEEDQDFESQNSEERATEEQETRTRIEELQERLKASQHELDGEVRKREELEIQLACTSQENNVLQEQLAVLREKEVTVRTFDEELASLDDASSGRLCRKCLGQVDELASNPTLYDLHDSIEDTDASIESIHGECALIRLKNGGYAWGSQESLASIGQVVSRVGSGGTSPGTEADAPHNSLLSELDTSYRILIEKYEALLEAREQQQHHQQPTQDSELSHEGLVHPGVDDMSGPMSLVMTDAMHGTTITMKCQRCHTCTCDLKPSVGRPKSNMEEFSEVETSSSGFSDGESRLSNKSTQTGEETPYREIFDDLTPTPTLSSKCLDLSSPVNPCDRRFQTAPEYKKLFQEIFTVLKKTVDEKDTQTQTSKTSKTPQAQETTTEKTFVSNKTTPVKTEECNTPANAVELKVSPANTEEDKSSSPESCNPTHVQVSIESKIVTIEEREIVTITKEFIQSPSSRMTEIKTPITPSTEDSDVQEKKDYQTTPEDQLITHKPPRPDTLDLGSDSRPSSRQKRRRRHHRIRLDSYQQQPFQGQYQYTHGNQNLNMSQQLAQSSHRHHRRERDPHQVHLQRQQPDDFPTLHIQPDGEVSNTRIVYNSSRGRCEHHRSRKHRDRSNNSQHHRNPHPDNADQRQRSQNENHKQQSADSESRVKPTTPKINYPSVEVAKLRKLEMTYAEALKHSLSRSYYNRRY